MKFASIVSCTDNYTPYLTAQLNSFHYYGLTHDYYLLAIDINPSYLEKLRKIKWCFNLVIVEVRLDSYPGLIDQGKNMTAKKARYAYLKKLVDYDAVLFLDCDLFAVRNFEIFFQMVAGTDIIVGVNERFKWQLNEFSYAGMRLPERRMDWMICNAPTFFDPGKQHKFIELAESASMKALNVPKNSIPSDLFTMNLALWLSGSWEKVFAMPSYAWTGVHHQYLTVKNRLIQNGSDGFKVENGEPVYMIHGRWDRESTWRGMLNELEKRYNELGMNDDKKEEYRRQAKGTIKLIRDKFEYFSHNPVLNEKELI